MTVVVVVLHVHIALLLQVTRVVRENPARDRQVDLFGTTSGKKRAVVEVSVSVLP